METINETPKTRKPRAKATVNMQEPTLEQPKLRKTRTKPIIKEPTLEQPKAKATATPKEPKPKEPKRLILQSEKEATFLEKSKLRQLKDAERIYNNAIKTLQR